MNPRALGAWVVAVLAVALSTQNPVYRGLVLLAVLDVLAARRAPGTRLRPVLRAVGVAVLAAVVLNTLLAHTGRDVLVAFPDWLPLLGGPVTVESMVFGVAVAAGVAAAALGASALGILADPVDVASALPAPLERTGVAVAAALAFVPRFAGAFTAVREAQLTRGWRPRGPGSWNAVLVPAVLTAVDDSMLLAEAMAARAFGSGPRTRLPSARVPRADALAVLVAVAGAVLFLADALVAPAPWYPYPVLVAPPVDPVAVAGCIALVAPAVRWSRSRG